jgi:hypothetical protein
MDDIDNQAIKIRFIEEFNDYIQSKKDVMDFNIAEFNEILDKYNKYAEFVILTNNDYYLFNLLMKGDDLGICDAILRNIIIIERYYSSLYDTIIIDINSMKIIHLYNKCLLHILIVLYQYYFIIDEIIPNITDKCSDKTFICLSNFFSKFIENETNKEIIENNEKLKNKVSETLIEYDIYLIIYKITIIRFNKFFFSDSSEYPIKIHYIYGNKSIYRNLSENFESFKDTSSKYYRILHLLNFNITAIVKNIPKINQNNYITIPQYSGYCWFVSFLTGLTYSDKNKNLLLHKLVPQQYKPVEEIDETTESIIVLYSIVYYIINNITYGYKTYTSNISQHCEIFEFFKKLPLLFLNNLKEEIKEEIIDDVRDEEILIKIRQSKRPKLDIPISEDKIKSKLEQILIEEPLNIDNYIHRSIIDNSVSLNYLDTIIIKKFYQMLNIGCLFVYSTNIGMYAIKQELQQSSNDYDIILISKQKINSKIKHKDYIKIENEFEITDDKLNIKFKEKDYELDYIMFLSDPKSCTDKNCGHCMCALQYNKKEYYYDSRFSIYSLACNKSNIIKIPCSLMEAEWTTNVNNEENNFCTIPCTYINNYIPRDILKEQKISSKYSNNLCFTNDFLIYCYVKKNSSMVEGGSKGKNTNKNVTRKVHFDKKLNKYYVNYDNNKIYLSK